MDINIDTAQLPTSFEADSDHFSQSFGETLDGGEILDNADHPHSITLVHAGHVVALLMPMFDARDGETIRDLDIRVKGDILAPFLCDSFSDVSLISVHVTFDGVIFTDAEGLLVGE